MKHPLASAVRLALIPCTLAMLIGCSADTSVSQQPSAADIAAAKKRRADDVDKIQGISDEQKQRMKDQILGTAPANQGGDRSKK